jgi:molecular chaperone GrpE
MPDETPAPGPEPSPANPVAAPEAEPKQDWETRFKYLFADFENFRRRAAKDREAASQQVRGALLRDLLPLLEAFRAATEAGASLPATDPLRRGFELLDREWAKFLRHEGVEPVAEVGRPFQAGEAEAVGDAPPTDAAPDGTVREVVQQGYRFFGGLLRPAKVIVARARPLESPASAETVPGGEHPEAES